MNQFTTVTPSGVFMRYNQDIITISSRWPLASFIPRRNFDIIIYSEPNESNTIQIHCFAIISVVVGFYWVECPPDVSCLGVPYFPTQQSLGSVSYLIVTPHEKNFLHINVLMQLSNHR